MQMVDRLEALFSEATATAVDTGIGLPGVYRGDPRGLAEVVAFAMGEDEPGERAVWFGRPPRAALVFAYARAVFLVDGLLVRAPGVEEAKVMCALAACFDELPDMARHQIIMYRYCELPEDG